MRAIVLNKNLKYDDAYPEPTPAPGECLVRVVQAGICSTDLQLVRGYMNFSGVLGHEMVGIVEDGAPRWRGKRVACEINCACGDCDMCSAGLSTHCRRRTVLGIAGRDGCFADRVCIPERNLHEVPDAISDEEAVFIEPLAAAWQVIKQVAIEKRTRAAVVGSGKLGLLVAQVINTLGCRVTVVGRNPQTLSLAEKRHIQAIHVEDLVPEQDHDLVVECTGSGDGMTIALGMVRPRGTIVLKSTYAVLDKRQPIHGPNEAEPPSPVKDCLDLAPAVIHEVQIIGSRCGPFPQAIESLQRRQIEVSSMISRSMRIDRGVEAFEAAADPRNVKVLLKINPR